MSGNIIELLQNSVDTSTGNTLQFTKFIQSCLELGSFYSQDKVDTVIKIINNTLNSSLDKEKGLVLLENFLCQVSVEAFSSNAFSWMVSCNKIISQKEGINNALALRVLSKLIKLSVKFPEVNKEVAKQIVPKFLLDHVKRKTTPQVSVELLECIESCMKEYPGPSGEFRLDIQRLLLSCVEARREVVEAVSRCAPLVAGVGGGGKAGVSHKTAWQRQQMALVRLLHSLLNRLYEHLDCQTEEFVAAVEDVELTVETIKEKNILTKSQRLATQFTSVALFLQAMLLQEFPVAKAVAPDAILDVVAHAQKPTLATLGSSREALAVAAVLPTVQVAALRLLESLVLCLGRNLIPHGGMVCYLCSQVVHWTHQSLPDWPYAMGKPFSQTRHAAYCCLHSWLTVAGAASQLETVTDKLLPAMLADIHAEKPSVRLRVGSKTGKGRKRQQVLVNLEDRSEKLGDSTANGRLCERALQTLAMLLRTTVARLKHDAVSDITNTVLRVVADLPVPYSDANCLAALYQLLLTLCLEPHPRLSPPLAPALAVFTAGAQHTDPKVRSVCVTALSCLDKIIHPTAATLYFPPTLEKRQLGRESVDEDDEEDESSMPVLKRMRIESLHETRSDNSDGIDVEEKSKVKPLEKKQVEVIDCFDSNDSDEIVELVPIDSGEKSSQMEESSDEEIDILEITEVTEEDRSSVNNDAADTENSSSLEEKSKEAGFKCLEENNKPQLSKTSDTEVESNKGLEQENGERSEEDADVSQMLMDFTDEVNES